MLDLKLTSSVSAIQSYRRLVMMPLKNKDIVKVYQNSSRGKERLIQLFSATYQQTELVVRDEAKNWIKQYLRRWSTTHGSNRFEKKYAVWLNSVFEVNPL